MILYAYLYTKSVNLVLKKTVVVLIFDAGAQSFKSQLGRHFFESGTPKLS